MAVYQQKPKSAISCTQESATLIESFGYRYTREYFKLLFVLHSLHIDTVATFNIDLSCTRLTLFKPSCKSKNLRLRAARQLIIRSFKILRITLLIT